MISIYISILSLLVSTLAALHTIYTKRIDTIRERRKSLVASVESLIEVKQRKSDLQRELGPSYMNLENSHMRRNVNEKIRFHLSQAMQILSSNPEFESYIFSLSIGDALFGRGEIDLALAEFRKAIRLAPNDFEKALAFRAYGRSLVEIGSISEGEDAFAEARETLVALAKESLHSSDSIYWEICDLCGIAARALLNQEQRASAKLYLDAFSLNLPKLRSSERFATQTANLEEVSRMLGVGDPSP